MGSDGADTQNGMNVLKRYHFDLENGSEVVEDQDGVEAFGLEEAVTQAQTVLAELRDTDDLPEPGAWTLVVRGTDGAVLTRLRVE